MKLATNKFNDQDIQLMPTKTTEMGIGKKGIKMAMDMFTKQMYSNPIGSVVREIASNSVDSHVEAGVTDPIKIKLLYEESGVYVSFQDFGVGMNPNRVETIYGRYFESTKRETNDEIGGFGVGGKSPMAYSDSFFVDTISNKIDDVEHTTTVIYVLNEGLLELQKETNNLGDDKISPYLKHLIEEHGTEDEIIKRINFLTKRLESVNAIKEERIAYTYCIFKGENAPVIQEMYFRGTIDSKGTEVKIPIKKDDIGKFSNEIKRQLYYFNNVVFEGWDGAVVDDYTIYKGKTFVYRGNDYERNVHVCLGDVAYPINYHNLPNISVYDYNVPVAITLNIGDVEITPERENLLYSEKTISVITKKLEEVKKELNEIYSKQLENVISLEDYLHYTFNRGSVKLGNSLVNINTFVSNKFIPKNFKYAKLNIKNDVELFKIAFNHHKVGITKRKGSYSPLSYNYLINDTDVYSNSKKIFYSKKNYFMPNNYKKAYIKQEIQYCTQGHVVVTKKDLKTISDTERLSLYMELGIVDYNTWENKVTTWNIDEKKAKRIFNSVVKDIINFVEKHIESYDFEAPAYFIEKIRLSRRKKIKDGEIKLSIRDYSHYEEACEIKLSELNKFKGRIFYSIKEDEDISIPLKKAKRAHVSVFSDTYIFSPYNDRNYKGKFDTNKKSIMFIRVRKNQIKHFEKLKNSYHANNYYKVMLSRKYNDFVNYFKKRNLEDILLNIPAILKNPSMRKVDAEIYDAIDRIKNEAEVIKTTITNDSFDSWYGLSIEKIKSALKINENNDSCANYKSKKDIKYIKNIQDNNEDVFKFMVQNEIEPFTNKLVMLLDLGLER